MGISWRAVADRLAGRTVRGPIVLRNDAAEPLLDEDVLRQILRIRLETGASFTDWLAGEHVGQRKTQALEFDDYRGYVPGDDFRLIDWNSYARLGDLHVKTSLTDEAVAIHLLVDCSKSMDWGTPSKLRYAERLAAALGALALLHGDLVQVFGLGAGEASAGAPLRGPGDIPALAGALEALPVVESTDLHSSVTAFQQIAEPHGVVIVFSDLLVSLDHIDALEFLELEGRTLVVIHIVDPLEAHPNMHGPVELRDRETGAVKYLSVSAAVRDQYVRRFDERLKAIRERVGRGDARYIFASTAISPIAFVANGLRGEGIVTQA
jgi:uncharacterized protein (DUF58 family)